MTKRTFIYLALLSWQPLHANLVGLWTFDDPEQPAAAALGDDLTISGVIGHSSGAAEFPKGAFMQVANPIGANGSTGDPTRTNHYTIVLDFMVPDFTDGGADNGAFTALFDFDMGAGDADFFIRKQASATELGVSTQWPYVGTGPTATGSGTTGTVRAGTWYRLILSANVGTARAIYLDGNLIGNYGAGTVNAGRQTLGDVFRVLWDEDGEQSRVIVDNLALFDRALSAEEATALGTAGDAIPVPENLSPRVVVQPAGASPVAAGATAEYTFEAVDPDSATVQFEIEWGDGSMDAFGPLTPVGTPYAVSHTYVMPGTYRIRARVRDAEGNTSAITSIQAVQAEGSTIVWTGALNSTWSTATLASPKNWVQEGSSTPTDFTNGNFVLFDASAVLKSVSIDGEDVIAAGVEFNASGENYTLQGSHGIAGATGLIKDGTGTLTISNPNTFTGGTSVSLGELVIDHEEALRHSVLTTFFPSGVASFGSPAAATVGGLGGDGDIALVNASAQPVALTLDVASGVTAVHGGELSGPGSLVKTGAGTQSMGFPGSYSGGTTIAGGILRLQDGEALGTGDIVHAGGELRFGSAGELVVVNDIVLPSTGRQTFMIVAPGGGAPTAGATAVLEGKISGGGEGEIFRLVDSGTGLNHNNTLVLTNDANDFQGTIEMWRGTLAIASDAALGDPENDITHYTENLAGSLRFDSDGIVLGAGRTIHMPGANNSRPFNTLDFTATIIGPVTGTGSLVKQGTGTLIIAGDAKTYTGTTTVADGTLRLDAGLEAAANPVNVAANGTLAGTGGVARVVNVNGGTLAPGASVGTLPVAGALSFGPDSRYEWEIGDWNGSAGAGYDTVTAASLAIAATAENPVIIVVSPLSLANFSDVEKTFTLVSAGGAITGFDPAAFTVDASALPGATAHAWSVQAQGNRLALVYGEVVGTPFDLWAASRGLSGADAAFDADPDGDGIKNGLEFVLGGEPNPANPGAASTAILPKVSSEEDYLVFIFRRAIAAKDLASVEYNGDLGGTWTTAGVETMTAVPDGEGFEHVEVRIPKGSGSRLFARLRAEP